MAGGLFVILDDIAMLLDDAAAMTKLAAKKTAAILGDDLAVNAEKASGFHASRELPVLWAITKGSLINKMIILPLAFLLSAYAPWLIVPILLVGGTYLSFEGVEKIWEWFFPHKHEAHKKEVRKAASQAEMMKVEKNKIKSAIITDFILSIEIIMIALGTVMDQAFFVQLVAVSVVAMLATIGVYGLVALLVRMDDTGLWLINQAEHTQGRIKTGLAWLGRLLIISLPKVIKALSIIGTIAMLLVGGGMFVHNLAFVHHWFEHWPLVLAELFSGFIVGAVVFPIVASIESVIRHK